MTKLDDAIAASRDRIERIAKAAERLDGAEVINVEEIMRSFAESRIRTERIMRAALRNVEDD